MKIYLYNNPKERNFVDKSAFLTNRLELNGTLRNECSIINPVIEVQSSGLISNYAYIVEFGRYYFIDEIISIRNDLWRLRMTVDVLTTYSRKIQIQTAHVIRCLKYKNVDMNSIALPDEDIPLFNEKVCKKIDITGISDFPYRTNSKNTLFYIITAVDEVATGTVYSDKHTFIEPAATLSPLYNGCMVYFFDTLFDYDYVKNTILNNSELNNYVLRLGAFSYANTPGRKMNSGDAIYVGNKVTALPNPLHGNVYVAFPGSLSNEDDLFFTIPPLDIKREELFSRHSKILAHLPYYGNYELPKNLIYYDTTEKNWKISLTIATSIDLLNGILTYNLINTKLKYHNNYEGSVRGNLFASVSVEIYSNSPIARSNYNEIKLNETANLMKSTNAMISSSMTWLGNTLSGKNLNIGSAFNIGTEFYNIQKDWEINSLLNIQSSSSSNDSNSTFSKLSDDSGLYLFIEYNELDPYVSYVRYGNLHGYSVNILDTLTKFSGFTLIGSIHIENIDNALSEELNMIERELKRGVIFP